MLRRRFSVALVLTLALFALVSCVTLVSAHAHLKAAMPADKSTVPTAPAQVVLTFTEETSATMSTGSVVDASGATVSTGFMVDLNERTKMTILLKPNLGPGLYTVKYHTLTEDDNGVVDDTATFMVLGTAGANAATMPAATQAALPVATTGTTAAQTTARPSAAATTAPTATVAPTVTTTAPTTAPTATMASSATATGTVAPTATRTAATVAPTVAAPRIATAPIATGTGGGTALPATGNPRGDTGVSWLALLLGASVLVVGLGFMLRSKMARG